MIPRFYFFVAWCGFWGVMENEAGEVVWDPNVKDFEDRDLI